ncbi:MAG: type I restriction enzyme HsdR N-terminal domain-containing protein [Nitrospirota bacterium]
MDEERNKIIQEKIQMQEQIERMQLQGLKQQILGILIEEKKFDPAEVEADPEFVLKMSDREAAATIDFIVNLPPGSFMVIRCVNSGLESWERYITAFARAVKEYQIPYAVITNGEEVRIIDVLRGSLAVGTIDKLFTRQEALEKMRDFKKVPFPTHKLEREKRIIYAFEGIKCPSVTKP